MWTLGAVQLTIDQITIFEQWKGIANQACLLRKHIPMICEHLLPSVRKGKRLPSLPVRDRRVGLTKERVLHRWDARMHARATRT